MTTRVQSSIAALFAAFLTSFPVFAAPPPTFTPFSVVPIFFVPTDWKLGKAEVKREAKALQDTMVKMQKFYRSELGGTTFVLDQLHVIQAELPKEGYDITWHDGDIYAPGVISLGPSFEHLVVSELDRRGYPIPPGQNESGFVTVVFVKGAGSASFSREFALHDGGWALLGDWTIDGIQGQVNGRDHPLLRRNPQRGKTAQMIAGAFGVPHPTVADQETTIVHNWPSYPTVGLNQHDVDYLIANKSTFFRCSSKSCLQTPTRLTGLAGLNGLTQAVPEPASVVSILAGMLILLVRLGLPARLRAILTEYLGRQATLVHCARPA